MAVLKDLIVHGASRFLNGINTDAIHANLIDAQDGVFKTITTTTLDAQTITTDMLKANNARVSQTLTVDGTISTNKWEAANIANIGGNFYISPTGKTDLGVIGTITVTKTSTTTTNGVSVGVYTLVVSGTFGVTSTSSTIWGTSSKVIFTGSISYPQITGTDLTTTGKKYPLGTCNGTMTAVSTGTNTLTGFTITGVNSPALDVFFKEVGVTSVTSTACSGYEMQISVYQSYSNSALRPIGILLTSYGKEKKQYIDIYGGANALSDSATGFANPSVRIGQLDGLSDIRDGVTDSSSPTKPSGWGIYTTNGFFKGKIVSNAGLIAGWTISDTALYNGSTGINNTTSGAYLGCNSSNMGLNISGGSAATTITITNKNFTKSINGTSYSTLRVAIGSNFGMDSSGNIYANGANITNINANNISTNMLSAMQAVVSKLSVLRADMGTITAGVIKHDTVGGTNGIWFSAATNTDSNVTVGTSGARKDWRLLVNNKFGVTTGGVLYASGVSLSGAIEATSFTAKDYYENAYRTRAVVDTNGLTIYDGSGTGDANVQARFGSTVQVGKKAVGYVSIASTGMDIYAGSSNINLAHFGYDSTETSTSESSTVISNSPFFSMGQRRTIISSERGDNAAVIANVSNRYDYDADQEMPVPPGSYSTVIGYNNVAIGPNSCAEGNNTITYGNDAHSEGYRTAAIGFYSHAEGYGSEASNSYAHAEGWSTVASGLNGPHAEGFNTTASGATSHAEGSKTTASGNYSHAEGCETAANGGFSHAGGYKTSMASYCTGAFVHGIGITANAQYQTIFGKYPNVNLNHAFEIGNGTENDSSNALAIDWDGNLRIKGNIYVGCNASSSGGTQLGSAAVTGVKGSSESTYRTGQVSLSASDVGAVPTNGNAGTCSYPAGFASRTTGATWGNTIGTSFTSWNDSTGGSIDFRQDNPSSGKVSIKVDGRFYYNEGNTAVWGLTSANGYWGMTDPDGNTSSSCWIRTTQAGIIPYQSGGRGGGHNYVGTDSWYFSQGYIDNIHGVTLDFNAATISGTTTIGGVTRINNSLYCDILYAGSGVVNADLAVGGTLRQVSDRKVKTHLKYLNTDSTAIKFIQQLRPAYYIKNNKPEVGFYAQDIQEIDPWNTMVESDKEGMLNLSYTEIIAPLVSYCHSLEKRIKELEARK